MFAKSTGTNVIRTVRMNTPAILKPAMCVAALEKGGTADDVDVLVRFVVIVSIVDEVALSTSGVDIDVVGGVVCLVPCHWFLKEKAHQTEKSRQFSRRPNKQG
jgi:hypothetical protein